MAQPNKTFSDSHIIERETQQLPRGASCLPPEAVNEGLGTLGPSKGYLLPINNTFLRPKACDQFCTLKNEWE